MSEQPFVTGVGQAGKLMVIDISPGSDLLTSVLAACRERGITSAVIVYCIGSLRKAEVETIGFDPNNTQTGVGFGGHKVFDGPIQVLSGQGCVGLDEKNEYFAHMHIIFVDGSTGQIFGGHLPQGGAVAINRLEVGLIASEGMQILTELDSRTGHLHLIPRETGKQ